MMGNVDMQRTEVIAAACHSAWYAYTVLGLGEDGEPWDTAPEWQRESIRSAVAFWDGRMEAHEAEDVPDGAMREDSAGWARDRLPALSHEHWMASKRADGWIFGEKKDPKAKTHHCLVPYCDLHEAQRKKDAVVVEAYLALRAMR